MTPPRVKVAVVPINYRLPEAAAACGMSVTKFNEVVRPDVRCIRKDGLLLWPVADLERWSDENAEMTL